jgi:hypothetical protein
VSLKSEDHHRHLPPERRPHRDRPAQARGAGDVLRLRLGIPNAGARLILAPDWEPVVWTQKDRMKGQAWGLKTIESFHTQDTPPVKETA